MLHLVAIPAGKAVTPVVVSDVQCDVRGSYEADQSSLGSPETAVNQETNTTAPSPAEQSSGRTVRGEGREVGCMTPAPPVRSGSQDRCETQSRANHFS